MSYLNRFVSMVPRLASFAAAVFTLTIVAGSSLANPKGGQVVFGDVDINGSSQRLDITQTSSKAIIDWQSFSIDADELVRFNQPSASSMALNRVRGSEYSAILGQLIADGNVLLINPNGIIFGKDSQVDVSGLVATSIDISDENFLDDRLNFDDSRNSAGTVVNRGTISAAEGGLVALVAPGVENSGLIHARLGRVALGSGNSFTLDLHGDNLVQLAVDDTVAKRLFAPDGTKLKALVGNSGKIIANGGSVVLTAASAAKDIVDNVINVDGIIEARSAVKRNGKIVLQGTGKGVVRVAGKLNASGRKNGETGGKVKVLGEKVGIVADALIDVSGDAGGGEVLVGGNFQGKGPERNADYTTIGSDAEIQASAVSFGDGGRVIVWSDRVTRFSGSLTAQGGSTSGDGGFAEVSGKEHLQFAPAKIDLNASNGSIGKLLLDPRDVTISDANGSDDGEFAGQNKTIYFSRGTNSTTDFNIKPSAFETINADVIIQATRDITVSSPIDRSGAANSTLTLQAGRNLTISANITGTNGAHSYIFSADSPQSGDGNNGTGSLTIGDSVTITSNGGSITLIGADFEISTTSGSAASINAGSGGINVAPSQSTSGIIVGSEGVLSTAEIGRFISSGIITLGTATTGKTGSGTDGTLISAASISLKQALSIGDSASLLFNSAGSTTLSANISTTDGKITFSDPVVLSSAVTMNSDSDNDTNDGNIVFNSTVNGSQTLSVTAGTGSVTFSGTVGSTTALTSLTVSGAQIDLDSVMTTGLISVTGTNIDLNGANYYSDDGNIYFYSPVDLHANVIVDSDRDNDTVDGKISFTSTINSNGSQTLTLDADKEDVSLLNAIGGTNRLSSLTVTGNKISLDSSVATTGAISLTGLKIDLSGGNYNSQGGNISFIGAVNLIAGTTIGSGSGGGNISFSSTVNRRKSLTVTAGTGSVTFSGAVGGTTALASLAVTGSGGINIATNITTSGNIDFNSGLNLNGSGALTITSGTGAGNVAFDSTVNGGRALTVTAGTGSVTFSGAVGGTTKLTSLTVSGVQIDLDSVATTGVISVTGSNIDLNGANYDSDDGNITFTGSVDLHSNVTIESDKDEDGTDGNIVFTSTINSATDGSNWINLYADRGAVELRGAVGGTNKPYSILVFGGQMDLNSIEVAAEIDVQGSYQGSNIDLNGTTYYSNDGNIVFMGVVDLHANVSVDSDNNNDSTDGDITFTSTINGAHSLMLDADTGSVDIQGAIGSSTRLTSLNIAGGQIDLNTVATTGAISVTGTNIDLNAATYWSNDGDITFTGPVDLRVNVSVDSDKDSDTTDGDITFTSTVDAVTVGTQSLTLDAGTGDVDLQGAVGSARKLNNLSITGGNVTYGTVNLGGTLTVTATGTITLKGDILVDDTSVSFGRPVVLGANVTIDTDADNDSTDGDITFTSTATINGGFALTLDADTGAVNLQGAVGSSTRLTSLNITGGQIDLNTVATTGAIVVTGTNIDLNAGSYNSQGGNISFTGSVDLDHSSGITISSGSGGGNISFSSTVDGGRSLTVTAGTGSVTFSKAVGGTTALTTLAVTGSGGINIAANITTTGNTDFNSGVTLTGSGALTITSGTGAGNIAFDSKVDGGKSLTVTSGTGSVTFLGAVGGTTALTGFRVTGGSASLKSVTLTGTGGIEITGDNGITLNGTYTTVNQYIYFNNAVTLAGAVTVNTGAGDGTIEFSSTVDAETVGTQSLTLSAGTGNVFLLGAIGGTTRLSSFAVSGATIGLNTVATTNQIVVEGSEIDLNAGSYKSQGGNITFSSPVNLNHDATITVSSGSGGGNILFSSLVDGEDTLSALTVTAGTGSVTFSGAVGSFTRPFGLTVSGGQIDLNTVATTGVISVTGTNIDLNAGSYNSQGGNITFTGSVDLAHSSGITIGSGSGGGNISFSSTVNGGRSLTVTAGTGSVTFSGAVGSTTALTSLTVSGGQIDLNTVATTGAIVVTGTNIDLNAGSYNSQGGNGTFTGSVDLDHSSGITISSGSGGGDISFSSTVNGGRSLTVTAGTGSVTFSGAVGSTTALTSLTVSGGQIDLNTVAATGAISVTGTNIDLNAATYWSNDGDITFTGPVDLHVNVSVDSDKDSDTTDGDITFTSTVDAVTVGTQSLTLDADTGDVDLQGAVGGARKLNNISITGGNVTYGTVSLGGTLTVTATGTITLKGDILVDDTSVSFGRPVVLGANVTIDTDADNDSTDGDITFTSTATINGGFALTLDADTGAVNLQGAVGSSTRLTSLNITGSQIDLNTVATTGAISVTGTNIDLNAGSYNSQGGNISFTGLVDLDHSSGITISSGSAGGNISFSSKVDGGRSLTVTAGTGSVTFSGAVGGTTALTTLAVTGSGGINIAANITTTGNIDFNSGVTLTGSGALTITSGTGAGNIAFDSTLNGGRSLTVTAGTGSVTFSGVVGGTTALTTLAVTGSGGINIAANITTTGNIDFNSGMTLTGSGALTITSGTGAGNITFDSTVNGGRSLTVTAGTGLVTLSGAVGGTTALTSLTITGGQIDLNTVATTGVISVTGTNIDLNAGSYNSQGGNITFTGSVDLAHSSGITISSGAGGGNISFSSTVDGGRSLTVTAGTGSVTFSGAVGGTTALTSLTVSGGQIDLNTVATTGVIAVTGSNIDLNAATYWSNDGDIIFGGAVDLHVNVSVDSDKDNDTADGDITFTSTVDAVTTGTQSLTLDAGTGDVDLQGAVGSAIKLNNLSITGGNVTFGAVSLGGTLTVTSTGTITLKGDILVDDTSVSFGRPVVLGANVTIDTDADNDSTDGDITFTSTATINGGFSLILDADTGAVNLQGAVGSSTRLTSLKITGGQIDLNTVATTGMISVTGSNIDLNAGNYNSQGGNITFTGSVDLDHSSGITIGSGSGGGNISFSSTVDGGRSLTVTAGTGSVTFSGVVGGTTALTSLTVSGGQIDLSTVATTGAISVTGSNIDLNAGSYNSQGGNITFTGSVDLDHSSGITISSGSAGGNISFSSTVDGGRSLTVTAGTGSVTFSGVVGGTTALTTLSVTGSGGINIAANITTTGNIDFNSGVTLTGSGALTITSGTGAGNIAFDSTVNGGRSLTVTAGTGSVTFSGAVGSTTALTSLTVSGGQIDLSTVATAGMISVTGSNIDLNAGSYNSQGGNITFTGSVDLDHSSGITISSGSGGGNISFSSTVDGGRSLTVTAGTGSVTFSGAVGSTTALTSLTVSGGQIDLNTVATTGAIAVTGSNIDLNAGSYNSQGGNITFTGSVDLDHSSGITISSGSGGGNISFSSTVDGGRSLTVTAGTGSVTFSGAVGGTTALTTLEVTGSGGINIAANITTTGNIDFNSEVTLTGSGALTITSGTGAGNIALDSTVDGGRSLTVTAGTGSVTFSGAVGGTTRLSSLTVSGGQIDLNTVATTGAISVTGSNIDLNAGSYNSQGGNISFTGPVDLAHSSGITISSGSGVGNISFSSTVDGGRSLTVTAGTGSVTLSGAVGGTTRLANLVVSGGQIDLNTVATTGAISVTGSNIDLNARSYNSQGGNIIFTGSVDLAHSSGITISSGSGVGNISFSSTVDGGRSLTVTAGTGSVIFSGAVGSTTRLASLTVSGGQIELNTVATTGVISVTGSNIDLNAGSYSSQGGNISFTGSVDLAHSSGIMISSGSGVGNISFSSTVDGGRSLTVTAGTGSVTFSGAVGGTTRLSSLTVSGGQIDLNTVETTGMIAVTGSNIDLNAGSYNSQGGNISFTGPVDFDHSSGITISSGSAGGDISFSSTVDGGRSLTVTAGTGSVTFSGVVGGTTALTTLAVTGSGGINIAANITTTGNIDFNSGVTLTGSGALTITSGTGAGNIAFDSTVDGGRSLTVTSGTGSVTFSGAAGNTTRLASLTVSGDQIDLNTVATTGMIAVTGSNIDLNAGSYNSQGGNISFTGSVDLDHNSGVTIGSGSAGGDISFSSTVDGGRSLTVTAGTGSVTFSRAVGGTTRLASLTVNGGQIDLDTVETTGEISVTGTNIDLNAEDYNSQDANIRFAGPVDLHSSVTVDSDQDNDTTDGDITFTDTINAVTAGTQSLTLDADGGAVNLQGATGGTTQLSSLTITGGQIDLAAIATEGVISVTGTNIDLNGATYLSQDGNITFTGAVDLHSSVRVDSDENDDSNDGNIRFTSTIDAASSGVQSLTIDADTGTITVDGTIGGTTALSDLTTVGATVELKAGYTITGSVAVRGATTLGAGNYNSASSNFEGPVTLTGDISVTTTGSEGITFGSTITGTYSVNLNADSGPVTITLTAGTEESPLRSLTVSGGQINLNSAVTTGDLSVTGTNIVLNGSSYTSNDGDISFAGETILNNDVTIDSDANNDDTDGTITFTETVNATTAGAQSLTIDADGGAVNLEGEVGGTTRLASLTITGGQSDLAAVATTGAISVTGTNIDLNGAEYASDDGNINFSGPVDLHTSVIIDSDKDDDRADGNIRFTSTIDAETRGAQSLTLDADTGTVTVDGKIGAKTALKDLIVKGANVDLNAGFTVTGSVSLDGKTSLGMGDYKGDKFNIKGPVTLTGDISVTTTGSEGIKFESIITGAHTVILDAGNGPVTFTSAVGTKESPLKSLKVTGGEINLSSVATIEAISITGTIINLNGATYVSNDGNIAFNGQTNLHTDVTMDSDADNDGNAGSITFAGNVNGLGHSLTIVRAGDVVVDNSIRVKSFTQHAGTGTTDFGSNTLRSETFVDVTTVNIQGTVFANDYVRLNAGNHIQVTANVGSLTIVEARNAYVTGTVGGLGGQAAADSVIIEKRGPGIYKANGFTILGTGPGTRTYAEQTALPFSVVTDAARQSSTPASAVFVSFTPMLKASLMGAAEGQYTINAHEKLFPLFTQDPSVDCILDEEQCVGIELNY